MVIVDDTKYSLVLYIIFVVLSIVFMVSALLANLEAIFFSVILAVSRFLSGLGFLGIIFLVFVYLFRMAPKDLRKRKKGKIIAKMSVLIILAVALVIPTMELVKFISKSGSISMLSVLFGVLSFIVSMYLVPAWKAKQIGVDEGLLQSMKQSLGKLSKKIKRGYYYYFSKDYLKAYSIDFIMLKTQIDYKRTLIAEWSLPLIVIGLLYNPGLALIVTIYLLRYRKGEVGLLDNVFLTYAMLSGTLHPLLSSRDYLQFAFVWSIPYVLGGYLAFLMFVGPLVDLLLS